jgi:RNA polymerase sigma-70 factor (ECF subfamily)
LGAAVDSVASVGPAQLDLQWIEPCPEDLYVEADTSPECRYSRRESVALAFLTALQLLPPKQRAVVILRDVVGLPAAECAELLKVSVQAVKSTLQRARSTLDSRANATHAVAPTIDKATRQLLARYMEAWEHADVAMLVSLLCEDATLSMPPFREWLRGAEIVAEAIDLRVFKGPACAGLRMISTNANGLPAFAFYFWIPERQEFQPCGLQVVETLGHRISTITAFLDPSLANLFGLPLSLPDHRCRYQKPRKRRKV